MTIVGCFQEKRRLTTETVFWSHRLSTSFVLRGGRLSFLKEVGVKIAVNFQRFERTSNFIKIF